MVPEDTNCLFGGLWAHLGGFGLGTGAAKTLIENCWLAMYFVAR